MFGVLLSNELNKVAECAGPKKTDVMKKIAQLVGPPSPKPAPTPPPPPAPKEVTPSTEPPPEVVTPPKSEEPYQLQTRRNFNPGYNKMASQESTMNMFGVLVNMELQKIAQKAPKVPPAPPVPGEPGYGEPTAPVDVRGLRAIGEKFRKKQPVKQ